MLTAELKIRAKLQITILFLHCHLLLGMNTSLDNYVCKTSLSFLITIKYNKEVEKLLKKGFKKPCIGAIHTRLLHKKSHLPFVEKRNGFLNMIKYGTLYMAPKAPLIRNVAANATMA